VNPLSGKWRTEIFWDNTVYAGERAQNRSGHTTAEAGRGTSNAGRRKENSPLQCDMLLINPPLKGLKWPGMVDFKV
jgi:hypothetical protein